MRPWLQVVLVRPSEPGNIGATARAMHNLGCSQLALVQPCDHLSKPAYQFACNAGGILETAQVYSSLAQAVAPSHFVLGTTSRNRSHFRPPEPLTQFPQALGALPPGCHISLVFGTERTGLENEELQRCTHLITIPTATENPSLNLAQAVLLVLYQFHLFGEFPDQDSFAKASVPAISKELEGLKTQLEGLLSEVGFFKTQEQKASLSNSIADLVARAQPTRRDVALLRGMLHRMQWALTRRNQRETRGV